MKKLFNYLTMAMLVLSILPSLVVARDIGTGIGVQITPEEFPPEIWMCDSRVVLDDNVENGRGSVGGTNLAERIENYAFEGEQISWRVLAMDKNKIEQIQEVVGTIGSDQGVGNDIEVECKRSTLQTNLIPDSCEARILEEKLTTFNPDVMAYYDCVFTIETSESMEGEYWITVEAIGVDGSATIDENEYWYLNPTIALSVDGDMNFEDVRPGAVAYSSTLLVGNDADEGSGVLLDMFISGTDFYDSASSDAKCPTTNHLKLSQNLRDRSNLGATLASGATATTECNAGSETGGLTGVDNNDHICYYAVNGAYSTCDGDGVQDNADAECYRPIVYADAFTRDFYNDAEIIANDQLDLGLGAVRYDSGNVLTPGAEMSITFKLGLPEPCIGNFDSGQIYFWGEAI